jgi:hypothetical protein
MKCLANRLIQKIQVKTLLKTNVAQPHLRRKVVFPAALVAMAAAVALLTFLKTLRNASQEKSKHLRHRPLTRTLLLNRVRKNRVRKRRMEWVQPGPVRAEQAEHIY